MLDIGSTPCVYFASTGGHLAQAVKWSDKLGNKEFSVFVTFESPQSVSAVGGLNHHFIPYIKPRDLISVLRGFVMVLLTFGKTLPRTVVSTGAGIGLLAWAFAGLTGRRFIYIESVSRFDGPSLTGRLLQRLPKVELFCQHPNYPTRWTELRPLLSDFAVRTKSSTPEGDQLRIFVSLGTIAPYRFDRLLDAVLPGLHPGDRVVWQVGVTSRSDLPGTVHQYLDASQFETEVRHADVVITHGGVGTLLMLLNEGKRAVVMARVKAHKEHVDDHQVQVVSRLGDLGLIHPIVGPVDRAVLMASGSDEIFEKHIDASDPA